ncbi:hypothetical protein F8160_01075 [Bacillus sp. CH126_4D]|nr:hypothetical protein F8162_06920 [Bacillus sp. CH140a_4T]KAB2476395.1 hypothetical protein F8160_01075 [Bacillus sp. CH126_4D]
MYSLCYKLAKTKEDAEDIFQETWIKELKEICESKKGTFKATLNANKKYVLNISGLMVKDGFVKVNWEAK